MLLYNITALPADLSTFLYKTKSYFIFILGGGAQFWSTFVCFQWFMLSEKRTFRPCFPAARVEFVDKIQSYRSRAGRRASEATPEPPSRPASPAWLASLAPPRNDPRGYNADALQRPLFGSESQFPFLTIYDHM